MQRSGFLVETEAVSYTHLDVYKRQEQMNGYLKNVRQIKEAVSAATRIPASMNKSQYTDWNNIERVLLEADTLITQMIAAYYFVGDCYSGEGFDGN